MHGWHVAAGAKMVAFSGWSMPLEYPSGTVTEHRAVRSGCGIFDVSHMGNLFVLGRDAVAAVNAIVTNDVSRLSDGDLQYSMLCDSAGGVVDDMMITRLFDDRLMIVPNAANTAAVREVLAASMGDALVDHSDATAIIAVQGPFASRVLEQLGLPTAHPYMTMRPGEFEGATVMVSRSGYTGELGYELIVPAGHAVALWEALVEVPQVTPAGLGARDTLRTEMGYALHGHELTDEIGPVEAMLGWAVAWDKPKFHGRDALLAKRAAEGGRRLRGLVVQDRGVPRPGMSVLSGDHVVGVTTSGTFSPTLRSGVALALLDRDITAGAEVAIEVRGRRLQATVVKPPMVASAPR
jgi:aminomethyltransferase